MRAMGLPYLSIENGKPEIVIEKPGLINPDAVCDADRCK
jgi:hypothetical protein